MERSDSGSVNLPAILLEKIPLKFTDVEVIDIYNKVSQDAVKYAKANTGGMLVLNLIAPYSRDQDADYLISKHIEIETVKSDKLGTLSFENDEGKYAGLLCKVENYVEYGEPQLNKEDSTKARARILLRLFCRVKNDILEGEADEDSKNLKIAQLTKDSFEYQMIFDVLKFKNYSFDFAKILRTENSVEASERVDKIVVKNPEIFDKTFFLNEKIKNEPCQSKKLDMLVFKLIMDRPNDMFKLLTTFDFYERAKLVEKTLEREIKFRDLQKILKEDLDKQIKRAHDLYFLGEQSRLINQKIDNLDGITSEFEQYEEKISKLNISEEILKKLQEEAKKLKSLSSVSSEASVIKSYLDCVIDLPWNIFEPTNKTFSEVKRDLDSEHYGMQEIKEKICEYLAVNVRGGELSKSGLLLVGPPGVGKTTLARKIADALGRKFARISLGGVRDEAEIRGHRRTYLGSMCGKIIQAMRNLGSASAVILLDEVDKMGRDHRGDPLSALLELLDTEQNKGFTDHYLNIPFDMSKNMFICTANSLESLPKPFLDRLKIINLSSYSDEEKFLIAKEFSIKKQEKIHGLRENEVLIDDSAIKKIISNYTYEAGVRNLEEQISSVMSKALVQILDKNAETPISVDKDNLKDFLGEPQYLRDKDETDRVGVVKGLAWNQMGGDVLMIESVLTPAKAHSIKSTGKLGKVMQESIRIAFSYLRSNSKLLNLDLESDLVKKNEIHIHFPEGAVPKDGPSAGMAIFVTLFSLLTGKAASRHVAMTGELSLTGKVLAIGGVKEKILAARRNGVTTVLVPKNNKREVDKIDKEAKEGLRIIYIDQAIEALEYVFPVNKKIQGRRVEVNKEIKEEIEV